MNRLSELARDVGISEEYLRNTNQWNLIEELAERIVLECAEIANQYYKGAKHGPGFAIYEEIKQRFGVKP